MVTTTILSGNGNKLTLGTGRLTGEVDFGVVDWFAGAVDFSDIGATPGWARATGSASQPLLLPGAVTANGGINVVGTDAQGYLILGATTDYSQGGQIVSEAGAAVRLIETGKGGNLTDTPVSLAASGITDVGSLFNAYTTFNSTDTVSLVIGDGNTLRLGVNGGIAAVTISKLAITGGSLTAGGADDASGSLLFNATSDVLVSSQIVDNGLGQVAVSKVGAGVLTLSGTNTYTGATTVNAGTLLVGSDQALGVQSAVTVATPAQLDVAGHSLSIGSLAGAGMVALGDGHVTTGDNDANTTYSGAMTGSGASGLVKTGSGIFAMGGTSRFGTLAVDGGTLKLASTGRVTLLDGGTVAQAATFDHDGILEGDLLVEGRLTGNRGRFTAGTVTVSNVGVLSPGGDGAAGQLMFQNLTIQSGGIFSADLIDGTSYDQIVVNGTAQLDGQFLQIHTDAGWTPTAGQIYTVVSGSSISGVLAQVLPALPAGLTWEVVNDGTVYQLKVVGIGFDSGSGPVATPQQVEGIRALNTVDLSNPDLAQVFQYLAGLSVDPSAQLAAVDTLMGHAHVAALHSAAWAGHRRTLENLVSLDRLSAPDASTGDGRGMYAAQDMAHATALEDVVDEGESTLPLQVFGNVNYNALDRDMSNMGASAIKATGEGVTAGVGVPIDPSMRVGVAFAYDHVSADSNQGLGTSDVELFTGAVYLRRRVGAHWFMDGSLGLAHVSTDTERHGLPGNLTAQGTTEGYQWMAAAKVGYLDLLGESAWGLTPYGLLQGVGTRLNSYTETGAGGLNLSYDRSDDTAWLSTLGIEIDHTCTLAGNWSIRPCLGLGWVHRLNDEDVAVQTSFQGDPSVAFKTYGQSFDRDSIQVSLRADVKTPGDLIFYVEGQLSQGLGSASASQHSLNAGLRCEF